MRLFILLLAVFSLSFTTISEELNPELMTGVWLTGKGDAKVEIFKENGKYYGLVIWARDRELPDFDVYLLEDFTPKGKKLVGGKILNPDNGKKYSSSIKLSKKDNLKIKVTSGIFSKTIQWTRVK